MSRQQTSSFPALVAALVLGSALAAGTAHAASPNLLANPDFETGVAGHPWMPAAWDTSRSGLESVFFGRDNFCAHTGQYGVSVANASSLLPLAHHWSQTLIVTPDMWGKDLVFTIWTRNNGVDGRGYVLVQAFRDTVTKMAVEWKMDRPDAARRLGVHVTEDPAVDLGWNRVSFPELETDWVQREARVYLAPSTNVVFVRCGLIGTGQVMLDDASLTLENPLPAPERSLHTNLLLDPGFENEARNAWEYSLPPYPNMRATRDTVEKHSGRSSIHFSGSAGMVPGKAGAAQVLCDRALAGKRLRLTAYMKAESLKTSAFLKIFCHTATGMAQETSTRAVYGTTDWVPVIVEMDVPKDTYAVWAWMMYMAPSPGTVNFDDADLEVLGPATGEPTPIQSVFTERPPSEGTGAVEKPAPPKKPEPNKGRKKKS